MSQGKYVLKKEAWQHFDLYFPLYSLQEMHRAQERSQRFLPPEAPPLTPPPPSAAFSGLSLAANDGGVHALIYAVCFAATRREKEAPVSERLVSIALRLMQLAVQAHRHASSSAAATAAEQPPVEQPPAEQPPGPGLFGKEVVGCRIRIYCDGSGARGVLGHGWRKALIVSYDEETRTHELRFFRRYADLASSTWRRVAPSPEGSAADAAADAAANAAAAQRHQLAALLQTHPWY